jgi:hypothetical protein
VVVTNGVGSATDAIAMLYLGWPVRFVECSVKGSGLFRTCLAGPAGSNFIIECCTDGYWWTLVATNHAAHGIMEFMEPMLFSDPDLIDLSCSRTGPIGPGCCRELAKRQRAAAVHDAGALDAGFSRWRRFCDPGEVAPERGASAAK